MILDRARVLTLLATAGALGFAPCETAAQSPPTDSLRLPALMISIATGGARDMGDWQDGGPVRVASVQFLVGRHLAVESEVTHWKTHMRNLRSISGASGRSCLPNQPAAQCGMRQPGGPPPGYEFVLETDEGWSTGANLVFRSEPQRRVSGFGGGGAFVGQRRGRALGGQALGGADVRVTGPLRAYADLRFIAMAGQVRLAATGGVRVVARARPAVTDVQRRIQRPIQATVTPEEAAGKPVRVSLADGARRHGRFVSLSPSELLLRDGGQDIRYPLDQVVLVETVHHTARNAALVGFGVGLAAGIPVDRTLEFDGALALAMPFIGSGAGALIGVLMDMAAADKHVVHAATTRTVRVAPTLTPTRAGGTLTVRW
jgi:hypothetical protein